MSKPTQPLVKGLLWNGLIMTTVMTMIRGLFVWLGLRFSQLRTLLRVTGLWILLLPIVFNVTGALSNQVVLFVNHGTFPVSVNVHRAAANAITDDGMLDQEHIVMTSKTHLNLLADIFDWKSQGIESIGDLFIDFGIWLWAFAPYVWGFDVSRRLLNVR